MKKCSLKQKKIGGNEMSNSRKNVNVFSHPHEVENTYVRT